AFSPDGQRLVSGGYDQTLKIWDANTGDELLTLKGHTKVIHSVAFSPDGQRVASTGYDQTIKVWDAETGQESLTLKEFDSGLNCVAFSPDGHRLAAVRYSGSSVRSDGIKIWNATPRQLVPPPGS
ncbi:MAG: hypothetical protein IAG10_20465, partial [Planctomycetaceae bacterium]|nr:hypothetical protein [Planctomycetaceae bacterium]